MSAADSLNSTQANWGKPGYGPNPKENAQGMLFSNAHAVNKATNAANRTGDEVGHKGYSKNRLDAVREKLPVDVHLSSPAATEAITARHGGEIDYSKVTDTDHDIATRMTTNHVHDVVARSTVPLERIQGLPETRIRTMDMSPSAGSFNRVTGGISINAPGLGPNNQWGADTVIHELGHAVDSSQSAQPGYVKARFSSRLKPDKTWEPPAPVPGETTNNPMPMSSPENAATSEGFADAYALHHSRAHGGGPAGPRGEVPYENYTQRGWENYAGFAPDEELSPQNRAPSAYFEARATHGAAKQLDLLSGQFD